MAATTGRGIKPAHPGEVLRDIWEDMDLTQVQFAAALGVSRQTVAQLLSCRRNVSADMAHRLSRALNAAPGVWMRLQEVFDLWVTEKKNRQQYAKIAVLKSVKAGYDKQLAPAGWR